MSEPGAGSGRRRPDPDRSEPTPNPDQQALIDATEGIYAVDAGAGTGKTFAVTRRYASIVDRPDVEPDDVLLVTFTRSAATEMKERIVAHSDYGMAELADAPIQTFHSHCHDVLQEHGYAAPTHLGIDDHITGATRIVEDELVEAELFAEFFGQFRDDHPEYDDVVRALGGPGDLLGLVNQLAAKGVFPTADGWYRDGEAHLDGDLDAFEEQFDAVNEPRNDGRKQSELREALSRFGDGKTYRPDAPSKTDLRGGRGTKRLDDDVASAVFHEDRETLKAFVHDVYHGYIAFALGRNYLNFGFLQLFAFVALCEEPALRERASFEYVMVDEFQDSSEIQFKLVLLLAGTDNLCVVGDWKQSIYSFQYAAVENLQEFDERLARFAADLDGDHKDRDADHDDHDDHDDDHDAGRQRVAFDTDDVEHITLRENYRSTESILSFSEHALSTPATDSEDVEDPPDITSLQSNAAFDNSRIEACHHEDEHEAVLAKVQAIEGNDDYAVEDEDGEPRPPRYEDIAVLTRTRDFGRELLSVAEDHGLPMAYDGGVELFRTDAAKLLLAWLRILESDADRGWAVVMEQTGYTLDEIAHALDTEAYPGEMVAFRDDLRRLDTVGAVARQVFERYGLAGDYAEVILHLVQSLHDATTLTRGDLIRLVERGIDAGSTHEVHTSAHEDSVTVQTIHAAKGLEYPIVVLANMNGGKFPPGGHGTDVVHYEEPVGLRQRKVYADDERHPHVYDNWRYDVYRRCLPRDYDEERRLLYVAITRAESHLCLVGGDRPNTFLKELPVDLQEADTTVEITTAGETTQSQLPFAVSPPEGPTGYSPHSLMDDEVFEADADPDLDEASDPDPNDAHPDPDDDADEFGGGVEFGSLVHEFAEAYALGKPVEPRNDHERFIEAFLDSCTGELYVEEDAVLPLAVDGEAVTISGIVDLVHVDGDTVEVVDYKTDRSRRAEEQYRTQLSVYYHVLDDWFPERTVTCSLLYTHDEERVDVEPLDLAELKGCVREQSSMGG